MILFLGGIGKAIGSVVKAVGGAVGDAVGTVGKLAGGIVDTFSKIGGGGFLGAVGGLLGGPVGAVAGNLLGAIAGCGQPPLPKQFGSLLGRLPQLVQSGLGKVADFAQRVATGQQNLLGKGLDLLQSLLGKLLPAVNNPFQQLAGAAANIPQLISCFPAPAAGAANAGHAGNAGATSSSAAAGKGGDDALLAKAGEAYDQLGGIEKEIANLNPDDKDYQKKLMQLQMKIQKLQQMIQLLSNMLRMKHEMAKQVISNIRA